MADNLPQPKQEGDMSALREQALLAKRIEQAKQRSVLPALEALAEELEERAASGTLAEEFSGMKAGTLIHHLSKIMAALKTSSPIVVNNNNFASTGKDDTWLRANSTVRLTDAQRQAMRRRAEAVDAEVVEEKDNG